MAKLPRCGRTRARPDPALPDGSSHSISLPGWSPALGAGVDSGSQIQDPCLHFVRRSVRRELARRKEEAFLPDLAVSLGVKALIHRDDPDSLAVHERFTEAVPALLPLLESLPEAHTTLMRYLASAYLRACQAANLPPSSPRPPSAPEHTHPRSPSASPRLHPPAPAAKAE